LFDIVEIGSFSLYFALPVVFWAALAPIIGVITGKREFVKSAKYATYASGALLTISAIALTVAFITDRFDLAYVFEYSRTAQPLIYKFAAFYGGQAGSLLFWAWMLAIYMVVVVYQNRNKNQELMPYVMFVSMSVLYYFVFITSAAPDFFTLSKSVKSIAMLLSMAMLVTLGIIILGAAIGKLFGKIRSKNYMNYMLIGVLIFVVILFTTLALNAPDHPKSNPFETFATKYKDAGYDKPTEGQGLNPMLQNYGMIFHPPTLYMGYVGFTIPFAFAMAALLTKNVGSKWIASIRKWTVWSWFFLGVGIVFGAQWAYMELGWGGYWAWDPVENASFMPWLVGTAFMHSIMIQEKKNMLKIWNMMLIIGTFWLSLFGTFLTRSGLLSSVHSFGASSLGGFFGGILLLILFLAPALLFTRLESLKSKNELDSLVSREASFLINNLLLVVAALTVLWGTVFPLFAELFTGKKPTVGPPFYEVVMVPIALGLFLITAVCPLIAWRRATKANLAKNFSKPFVASIAISVALALLIGVAITQNVGFYASLIALATIAIVATVNKKLILPVSVITAVGAAIFFAMNSAGGARFILPGFLVAALIGSVAIIAKNKESRAGIGLAIGSIAGIVLFFGSLKIEHPWALTTFFLLAFIFATITLEFYRGTRIRYQHDKERSDIQGFEVANIWRVIKAFGTLIWKNKRRYGGYIVHVGIVLMFIGITASSTWKVEKTATLRQGESMSINNYLLYFTKFETYTVPPNSDNPSKIVSAAKMDVWQMKNGSPVKKLKTIEPQKNLHPNAYKSEEENQPITEVDLMWNLKEDLYVILNGFSEKDGVATFKVFINPLIVWMWIGGFVMIFGTIIVMWPDAREKKRLAAKYGS